MVLLFASLVDARCLFLLVVVELVCCLPLLLFVVRCRWFVLFFGVGGVCVVVRVVGAWVVVFVFVVVVVVVAALGVAVCWL